MSSSEQQRTPREVIERIRTHSFLLDLEAESEMVREGALNLQEQLNNALHLLSKDLYSKKSHFVLELVQNADDNHYGSGVTPHLTFQVTPKRLVSINNEIGFNEANIKAICSVGKSSKSKDKTGYIGEKGIGFKSVFTVSDAPEVHSNGFHFRFDRSNESNLLGYVVPHWCEPPADQSAGRTIIVLPAAKTYEFGAETLVDLDARLLLFLNKLRQLTLEQDGRRVTYRRSDDNGISHLTAERESDDGELLLEDMRYVRALLTFPMKGQFADEKRPGIQGSTVVLTFPVDETGAAKPEPGSYVFAFLPVRQMGFNFPIQADFILSSSREEILTDRPWNQLLRAGVAAVFSHAVEVFKKTEPLGFTYLKYIPAEGEIADPFFRIVRKAIIDQLAPTACLPSASGLWKQPSDLRIAGESFRRLFPSKSAVELFGFDYVDDRVQGGSELLLSLGAKAVTLKDVLSVFKDHGEWLRVQPLAWKAEFYAYIANQQDTLLKVGLLNCPCLPTSTETMVIPSQGSVFFPLSRAKRYGFEAELTFIDNQLYEEALKRSERVADLFMNLKVKADEPYDLVNSHIIPRHSGEAWMSSDFKALIGHLRYVKDKLGEYLASAATHGKTEAEAFQLLRNGIWIGTKLHTEQQWRFARVESLYLSKEYKAPFCIESILGDALEPEALVSPDYLAARRKDPDVDAESWRQFFTRLGVRVSPAVDAEGADSKCSRELQLLLDSSHSGVRKATLECLSVYWQAYSGRMSYNLPTSRSSHVVKDTKLALSLRATSAPTKKKATVPLAESYYPTAELKALFGDDLAYVDADLSTLMRDACHVTHKLDAKALIKRLQQLKAQGRGNAKQVQGIYRALDGRLWDSEAVFIRQSFHADGLIQTKGAHKGWSKPSEVSWRSSGNFMDSLYPPLQAQYRDFNRFFIDRLGVSRELPTGKWVEALTRLGSVEASDMRRAEALAIYRRANRDLMPKFGRDEVHLPDWVSTFESEAVYINQRADMVGNDDYLFANDAPELAALFDDDEAISFLAIPPSEVPRLSRLIDVAKVSRLSESIILEVIDSDSGVVDSDLTSRVRKSVPFFARVLYSKRPESFEQAVEAGRFKNLRGFDIVEVPEVKLSVSLGDYNRETTADIALSEDRILYRSGAKSVKDRLAGELCKFLGASTDLADTFARILMEDHSDDVEDFLQVRNIGVLPTDLLVALDSSAGPRKGGDDGADSVSEPDADTLQESAPDSEVTATDEGAINRGARQGTVPKGHVTPSPSPAPPTILGSSSALNGRASDSPSSGTHAPDTSPAVPSSAPRPALAPALSAPGADGTSPVGVPATGPRTGITGVSYPTGQAGDSSPGQLSGLSVPKSQTTSDGSPIGTSGTTSSFTSTKGIYKASRLRRGQPESRRTKAGRLLSYATGPDDTERPSLDENPDRAAAREATGRAAVEYFMTTQASRWKSLTEMPHHNPGFDVYAIADDGQEEYIEVKGQSGAWTEEGVALTPTELMTAQRKGERYWLCVVEYAQDDKHRQLYLLRNPYGRTHQFRFDVGWKSVAESFETVTLKPEKDMYITMPGVGRGQILSVRRKGRFFNLHVFLEDGRQVNKPFNPVKMTLSKEPTWRG